MSVRDIIQAAAGVGGGAEPLYAEDVFSTYVYTGTGAARGILNKIALGDFGVGTSTNFATPTDYLKRSSDMTGNTDGKTFTFSVWVYQGTIATNYVYNGYTPSPADNAMYVLVGENSGTRLRVVCEGTGGSDILEFSVDSITPYAWNHILFSIDMANTSNRYVYINDQDVTSSVSWTTYTDQNINFTEPEHYVMKAAKNSFAANLFLDYTYRDLSVEANRRYFIDANGGSTSPATLAALNPILYLPMTEAYGVGENLGTGGDFTVYGYPVISNLGTQYEAGYGSGGMVWFKCRSNAASHSVYDTERGATKSLKPNYDTAESTETTGLNTFNADGFTIAGNNTEANYTSRTFVAWTFRKAPKFFDVVTYTGNGSTQNIAHNLGSTPGCIIVKKVSNVDDWVVWHRSLANNQYLILNSTTNTQSSNYIWNNTGPTSTQFSVGLSGYTNDSSTTYVAYLFAHDAGGFGDAGDENVISCGSFSTDASGISTVSLGYEPQWLLIKPYNAVGGWLLYDSMRGLTTGGASNSWQELVADTTGAESAAGIPDGGPTATGFVVGGFQSSKSYIYIAIRRGPMKTPAAGTDVYMAGTFKQITTLPNYNAGFVVDMGFSRIVNATGNWNWGARLTGTGLLQSDSSAAELTDSNKTWDYVDGYNKSTSSVNTNNYSWNFQRAPGFFDVVCYTGTGSATTVAHNLGVAPELLIVKRRDGAVNWVVWASAPTPQENQYALNLNTAGSWGSSGDKNWGSTTSGTPNMTSTTFSIGDYIGVNASGGTYVAYLFASVSGVSKVGSYTGTGTTLQVNCGFSAGARFVLIKRTDSTGDWYVWDTDRGITSSTDPYIWLNSSAGQNSVTDYLNTYSAGFEITSSAPAAINASGGSFIFLAIA